MLLIWQTFMVHKIVVYGTVVNICSTSICSYSNFSVNHCYWCFNLDYDFNKQHAPFTKLFKFYYKYNYGKEHKMY